LLRAGLRREEGFSFASLRGPEGCHETVHLKGRSSTQDGPHVALIPSGRAWANTRVFLGVVPDEFNQNVHG
jgi:hypothetical protein